MLAEQQRAVREAAEVTKALASSDPPSRIAQAAKRRRVKKKEADTRRELFSSASTMSLSLSSRDSNGSDAASSATRTPIQITVIEEVDEASLRNLLTKDQAFFGAKSTETKFRNYARTMLACGCRRELLYRQKAHAVGRMQSNGVSLTTLNRSLRVPLAGKLYTEVDAANAHPVILLSTAERNEWPCKALKHYVDNREEVLQSFPSGREHAKIVVLAILMGGKPLTSLASRGVSTKGLVVPHFFKTLAREISQLRSYIYRANYELHHAIGQAVRSREISCMSFFLQNEELRIMLAAHAFLTERNWTIGAFVYDGLLVKLRDGTGPDSELLRELGEHVAAETSYHLKFESKPLKV